LNSFIYRLYLPPASPTVETTEELEDEYGVIKKQPKVIKKKKAYYIPKTLFAVCNFDLGLLPINLNLPMVCKPVQWQNNLERGWKHATYAV